MLLAAAETPDPVHFQQFWLIIAFLASVFSNVVVAAVVLVNRKQKREINYAFEPASKEALDQHVQETKANFQRMDQNRSEDLRASSLSRKAIYDKLDETRNDLTEKIEALPSQVIATLRNFGVIGTQ